MKKIQINVNEKVYEAYQNICQENDTSVAVELRDYMKVVVNNTKEEFIYEEVMGIAHQMVDRESPATMPHIERLERLLAIEKADWEKEKARIAELIAKKENDLLTEDEFMEAMQIRPSNDV